MISWIQRSFQHHFRLVFLIMLVVMAVPLIWVFNASSGMGRSGPKALRQRFFGRDLVNQGAGGQIATDTSLSLQMSFGFVALSNVGTGQLQQYGFERFALLALADQLKLPAPTPTELAAFIKGLRTFAGPDGQFDASRYAAFRDSLKVNSRSGVTEGDFSRVLSDDCRIERVKEYLVGPGYALPGEVRDQLVRIDSRWDVAVATAPFADFKPAIPLSEDALKRYFDDNSGGAAASPARILRANGDVGPVAQGPLYRYDVPPRAVVESVDFPAAKFVGAVTLDDAEVRSFYDANPARFPKPAAKPEGDRKPVTPPPANPDADFAAVRPEVASTLRAERAQRLAVKAASDFTLAVYDQKLKPHTPAFDALLAQDGLTLRAVAPFYRDTVPAALGWTPAAVEQALQLNELHAVSDPLPVADGTIVLFWKETLPSFRPELAQVRDRVVADYQEDERRKLFVQWGQSTSAQLAARIKAGASFEAAVVGVNEGPLKLVVKTYPPFVRRQPPPDLGGPVFGALDRLNQGQVSEMLTDQDKGTFVYVKEKKLPDLAETNPQYAAARTQLGRLDATSTASLSLSDLVARELKQSGVAETGR